MRLVLIADTFPPLRSSGAVQLRDLARECAAQGHDLTVLLPGHGQATPWQLDEVEGVQVMRLRAPRTKDIGYLRRTLAEFVMPWVMARNLALSPLANARWSGVIWYAPSIFHGPLARRLKARSGSKGYLIIRDIFPDWAADMGLLRRGGLPWLFFAAVARAQYAVADVIGVQTPGNLEYFHDWRRGPGRRVEVLQNWLGAPADRPCTIRIAQTPLAGRRIFVYAGNMGIAQGLEVVMDMALSMADRSDVGFLFVGRGSEVERLKSRAAGAEHILFRDEIHPDEIPDLYTQCTIGLVALDARHRSHNIPGKFLTYMQSGLPALASVNAGNDLIRIIQNERVGMVCNTHNAADLRSAAEKLLDTIDTDPQMTERCRNLFSREFSVAKTVQQIVAALRC